MLSHLWITEWQTLLTEKPSQIPGPLWAGIPTEEVSKKANPFPTNPTT